MAETEQERAAETHDTAAPAEPHPAATSQEPARPRRDWTRLVTRVALALGLGSVLIALLAALGAGQGLWHFRIGFTVLRYAFFAAIAAIVIGIVGIALARRRRSAGLMLPNLLAVAVALAFVLYLGSLVMTAKSVPAIHDVTTNLDDVPQFSALKLREDNLDNIPDEKKPELKAMDPESRWKAVHREHYGDLKTATVPLQPADVIRKAGRLARDRGWEVAKIDTAAGILEATDTSRFFHFKDDVVVRARPAADGSGSLVDMRSVSRVGASDVGVNAKRVRAFMGDLAK
jgi:hypothetical protein